MLYELHNQLILSLLLYIDPGTGSYLFQLLIAGIMAIVFFYKHIIGLIKNFFTKKKYD